MKVLDFPKLESPFIRETNDKGEYVVTNKVNPNYSWVFDNPDVLCVEKLDGTNVSIIVENGQITSIWNRTARIPFFCKGKEHIIQGLLRSFERGYCDLPDGQHFGELIGEKVNGNPQNINGHLWIPFETYARESLAYKSWHKYPKTFANISKWFEQPIEDGGIFSLLAKKKRVNLKPEGVVFVHPDGRMAKLRRDMFDWWTFKRHEKEDSENG